MRRPDPGSRAAALAILIFAAVPIAFAETPLPGPTQQRSEPRIQVGDGTLNGARLEPYANAWLMSARFKDGRVLDQGVWTDLLRPRDIAGRKAYVRVQGMTYQKGLASLTINIFDRTTLAPISSEQHGPDGRVVKRAFNGSHVETRITAPPNGIEQVTRTDLPFPVYDFNGGMYGVLFAAQTLAVGATGALPAVAEFTDQFEWVSYKVVGREKVRAGSRGDVDAWVVEVGTPVSFRFWISDRAPYIIRLVLPDFVPDGDVIYEMIS